MATAMSCCHQHNHQPSTFSCSHRCYTPPPPAADPHLHCSHPFPAPSAAYSGPFCCPDSSYHQFQKRPNQHEFRRTPHHPSEPQSQTQCPVLSSLLRRIDVLESSFHRSSPPPAPTPLTLRDFAARTIQARFRVFLLRRSRAFREIKVLASAKSNLDALKSSIPPLDSSSLSREAMILIRRLETIQGVDKMTKEGKVLILRDFAQLLEVVEGMICVRRSDVSSKTLKDIRMARNDDGSRVSCSERLIDELKERVKMIQEVSEVLEVKDENVEDGSKRCNCKCRSGDLIQDNRLQSNAGKHVRFVEDSTSWVHNFDEYKKEAMSRPSDDDATMVYNFDEYSATRVHNFDEFRKEPMGRPSYDDDTAVYSATRIHDFDEYREECMSIPSDNVKNTEDAAEKQREDDEEVESDAEENGTVCNDLSQGTDGEDDEDLEPLESDVEETLVESDEGSEEDEENDTVNNDVSQGRDGESLESDVEENPEESFEGSEDEDGTEYESSEYEYETENEDYEDEDEMEDEDGEDEDEIEKGTHNDIPQDNKQNCDSAVMTSANVANSAQPFQQRATRSILTLSDLYVTKAAADALSGSRRMKNVICHQCYKRGHMKRNCWFNPARRCRDCNMLGHTREICTHFSDQQSQNVENS